jgi:hypothetical protein
MIRLASAALLVSLFGCGDAGGDPPVDPGPDAGGFLYTGSWTPYYPTLLHDGVPVESDHFIVYSNYSSQLARAEVSARAEALWPEILEHYAVEDSDFTWLDAYDSHKIHLFADYGVMNQSGLAYRDGAIMRAVDHANYDQFYTEESYRRVLKHEISHVVEFLLIGTFVHRQANDVWLREGGATYSGGAGSPIDTVAKLDAWRAAMANVPGAGNPIGVHVWSDFPAEILAANRTIEYYPLFQLATRILVEPEGNGTTMADLVALYDDLGAGVDFPTAFQSRFGISLVQFELAFFTIAESFLADTEAS